MTLTVAERAAPPAAPEPDEVARLEHVWSDRPGIIGWLTTVSHTRIAARYIATAFVFFLLGGLEAAAMRWQLSRPENQAIGPDLYNQVFTMHGLTMMFLFAVPIMQAVGLYFVPLMVGARDVAFPRLNALGYWVYLIAGVFLYVSFFTNTGPDAGWFAYQPLAGPSFTPGKRSDVWAQMVTFTEIASLIAATNLIVTTFKHRAPGMTLNRIPLFVWTQLATSFMVLFAMTTVETASVFMALDRLVGTHLFNPAEGGDPVLWQHLFWFFGHPEVYIIFLPATGFVSAILPAFTRRPVFGYPAMVLAIVSTAFLSFGLWVHHMFAGPIPRLGASYFTAASMLIAIPSGVQVFCWLATIWSGRVRFATPFLFCAGFIVLFVMGGVTGVMQASVPFDLQVHDTFFVVAHFHYVLVGGAVFPLFAALYYWYPKFTGRLMSERIGKVNFWLFFIGMNLTFFPMHILGLEGMPRRVYTYPAGMGWDRMNLLATIGAVTIFVSVVVFLVNFVKSLRGGAIAGHDPWGGDTLEWATASPPASYGFAFIPVVAGRSPVWTRGPEAPVVTGLRTDRREVLVTTLLDAEPDHRHEDPGPTIWPLWVGLAIGATFISAIFTPWAIPVGFLVLIPPFVKWAWPQKLADPHEQAEERRKHEERLAREGV